MPGNLPDVLGELAVLSGLDDGLAVKVGKLVDLGIERYHAGQVNPQTGLEIGFDAAQGRAGESAFRVRLK